MAYSDLHELRRQDAERTDAIARSHTELLRRLLAAPRLSARDVDRVDKLPGVYVWWLADAPNTCLKVGRARLGARSEGLRRRIRQHLSSNEANTVLARHLAGDRESPWSLGIDFTHRAERKLFLATRCVYQLLTLPELTVDELDAFETYIERELQPLYLDYIRQPKLRGVTTSMPRPLPQRSIRRDAAE
ncbi:MAG: hypothetical protein ABIU54_06130 [Candidatus Eisenbacteria bacterium]